RQRLARLLRVEERALFPDTPAKPTPAKPSPGRAAPAEPEPVFDPAFLSTPTMIREAFCMAAMIKQPDLIYKLNRTLSEFFDPEAPDAEKPLPEDVQSGPGLDIMAPYVVDSDFANPEYRNIFLAWHDALGQDEVDPVEFLRYSLDEMLRQHV